MALLDKALMLADGVAMTATGIVGAAINFGFSDIGEGKKLKLVVISNTTGTGSTSSNAFSYTVRTADSASGLSSGTVLFQTAAIAGDAHIAGTKVFEFMLPGGGLVKSRLGLYATETGTAAVNLTAFIVGEDWQWGEGERLPITAAAS